MNIILASASHYNPAAIVRLLQDNQHVVTLYDKKEIARIDFSATDLLLVDAGLYRESPITTAELINLSELQDALKVLLISPEAEIAQVEAHGFSDILRFPCDPIELKLRLTGLNRQLSAIRFEARHLTLKRDYDAIYRIYKMDFFYFGKHGKIYEVNEAHLQYMGGYTIEELIGAPLKHFVDPKVYRDGKHRVLKTLQNGEVQIFDSRFRAKNGEIIDVSVRCAPVIENEKIIGASCVLRNISGRKTLEREIEKTRKKYQLLFENAGDAIFTVDSASDQITGVNYQAVKQLGFEKEELLKKPFYQLWKGVDKEKFDDYVAQLNTTSSLIISDAEFIKKNRKNFAVALTMTLISFDEQSILQIIVKDMTEKKNFERLKEDLVSMIVHDLKNPLMSIMMATDLIGTLHLDSAVDMEQFGQSLELVRFNSDTLLRMISDMLDIQRMEAGKFQLDKKEHNIYQLVYEAVNNLNIIRRSADVEISYHFEEALPSIYVDSDMILRVLINIVGNALKYTPAKGWIDIRLSRSSHTADRLLVTIADTGLGIPEDDLELIFDKFAQARNRMTGLSSSGLGLTFCRMALQAHDCKIWAESTLGKGSKFYFELPVTDPEAISADPIMPLIDEV